MVTSYYIMKMAKNKKSICTEEYYSSLESVPKIDVFNRKLTCRVCLQDGSISIFDIENSINVKEALKIFGDIHLDEYDDNPKYLCSVCYKFLKSAILFRKIAQRTNKSLQQPLQIESPDYFQDHDYLETFNDYKSNENHKTQSEKNSLNEDFTCLEKPKDDKEKNDKLQCPTCKKLFTRAYYKTHMTMHNPDHSNEYVCDICGKSFRLKGGYHNHRLRHRTDYIYKCQLCPFKGRYVDSLKSHMRTHTGNYRYMCAECPARFLFKGNLNHHILVKHKEPQYKCDSCEKAFHTELNLQRHIDVEHLGIKSQVCNICGRAFGYRTAMMKHQRRVHKREKLKLRFNTSNYKSNDD